MKLWPFWACVVLCVNGVAVRADPPIVPAPKAATPNAPSDAAMPPPAKPVVAPPPNVPPLQNYQGMMPNGDVIETFHVQEKVVNGVVVESAKDVPVVVHPIILGTVGGIKPLQPTPWQAEIYSTAKYTLKDIENDKKLVLAKSEDAEFLDQRHAYEFHHRCGGVLIARDWIVTAQHCIEDADGNVNPGYFKKWRRVKIGTQDLMQGGATFAVRRVVLHDDYDLNVTKNDIALIQLMADKQTDEFNPKTVRTLRILGTRSYDPKTPETFRWMQVFGWGTQSPRKDSDPDHLDDNGHVIHESRELHEVFLNYVPPDECMKTPGYEQSVTPQIICAGYKPGGRDSCQGDSGGPLTAQVETPETGKWETVLVGIVAGGQGCAQPNIPGLYTYVPAYYDWMMGVINSHKAKAVARHRH